MDQSFVWHTDHREAAVFGASDGYIASWDVTAKVVYKWDMWMSQTLIPKDFNYELESNLSARNPICQGGRSSRKLCELTTGRGYFKIVAL